MFLLQVSRLGPLLIIYIISPCLLFTPSFGMFQHFWITWSFSKTLIFIWNLNVGKAMVLLLLLQIVFTKRKVKWKKSERVLVSLYPTWTVSWQPIWHSCALAWSKKEIEKQMSRKKAMSFSVLVLWLAEKKTPLD